jgi:hypothetical protein
MPSCFALIDEPLHAGGSRLLSVPVEEGGGGHNPWPVHAGGCDRSTEASYSPAAEGERMVLWAEIAAAVAVCIVAIGAWSRRRRTDDALGYDDFVQLGRAAWTDVRDDDRTRLAE